MQIVNDFPSKIVRSNYVIKIIEIKYVPVVHSNGNACIKIHYFQIVFDIDSILSLNVRVLRQHAPSIVRTVHHMIRNEFHM